MTDGTKISTFTERQKSSIKNMKLEDPEEELIWVEESCFFISLLVYLWF